MHSIDLFHVSGESPTTSYADSVSSEGVPTPLEGPQSHSDYPLAIDIPQKITAPLIGTPFITDSSSLFEYPFPVSPRPPLSSTSSSSSIPGPPSSATQDKHSSHILTRLSSRVGLGHKRTSSRGGLSPIPIPPRLRRLSGHMFDESTPTQHDIPPRLDSAGHIQGRAEALPTRDTVAPRPNYSRAALSGKELGPVLSSTPRACVDVSIASRRRSMPAVLTDLDSDHGYSPANEAPTRLRF